MREVSDDREPQQPSQPQQPPGSTLLPLAPPPPPPPPSSAAPPRIPTTIGEALLQSIGAWGQGGPARGDGGDDDDEAVVIHAREEDGRFECPICTKSFSTQKTTR